MKRIVFILLLGGKIALSQNLILNGDFEQFYHCPNSYGEIDSAKFWIQPTGGTSDYYNQCTPDSDYVNIPNCAMGFQQAHSGAGMAGIITFWNPTPFYREYIETHIGSTLLLNVCYHFEMNINIGNTSKYTCYNISGYFSNAILNYPSSFVGYPLVNPQINNISTNIPDSLNWIVVSGDYIAHGGENYLTIGNFDDLGNTDTININPSGTFNGTYVYIDDVSLIPCTQVGITTNEHEEEIRVFPNPTITALTINTNINEPSEVILYDVTSRKLIQQTFTTTITLNTEALAKGIYFYEVKNSKGVAKGKVVKQ